jgi:hypothetical protein
MLGPFEDTWDEFVNDNGDPLCFAKVHYTNATSTFRERVKPRDVKTALVLVTHLFLEHHTIDVEDSSLFDSCMLLIKASSKGAGVHFNSIGRPNSMFAWFVIDYLSMCILFDTFMEHRSLVAPMPFAKNPMSEELIAMLVHNKQILIKFCIDQGNSKAEQYFVNKKTGQVGRGCVDLDQIWSTSTMFRRKCNAGIVSSFESCKESYIAKKNEQKLWIHHFVILQLFHPLFRFYPGDDEELTFSDSNHSLFLMKINEVNLKTYRSHFGDLPNYAWLWRGKNNSA